MNILSNGFLVEKCTEFMGSPIDQLFDKNSLFNQLKNHVLSESKNEGCITQFFVAFLDCVGFLDPMLRSSVEKSLNKRKIYLIQNTPRYIPNGSKPEINFRNSPLFSSDEKETAETIHKLYHCQEEIQKIALKTEYCFDHTDEFPLSKQYEMLTEDYRAKRLIDYLALLALQKITELRRPTDPKLRKGDFSALDDLRPIIENGVAAMKRRDLLSGVMAYYKQSEVFNPDIAARSALQKIPLPS